MTNILGICANFGHCTRKSRVIILWSQTFRHITQLYHSGHITIEALLKSHNSAQITPGTLPLSYDMGYLQVDNLI